MALARVKHFGDAATELGISQPTLTTRLASLEKVIGQPLVKRDKRFRGLTPYGTIFLKHCLEKVVPLQDMLKEASHGTLKDPDKERTKAAAEAVFKKEVPEPVKKPKEFRPTPMISDDVCLMKADGWDEEKIAEVIGITLEQLKHHFPNELKFGVEQVRRRALRQIDKAAKKGSLSAANALLKLVGDMPAKFAPVPGLPGRPTNEIKEPKPKAAEPLGKKEQILADLADADKDSDWGGLVN